MVYLRTQEQSTLCVYTCAGVCVCVCVCVWHMHTCIQSYCSHTPLQILREVEVIQQIDNNPDNKQH